jgi:DNA-binding GntR family transcriptional regulator
MLQQEGLIIAEHNKRPRLLSFDPEVIDANAAEVILLFSLAATVSVPRLADAEIATIENSLKEMRQAAERDHISRWLRADFAFHAGAFVHAGAPLHARLKRVCDENQYYLRFLMTRQNVPWETIDDEHEAIRDACAARNGELASRLIARHLAGGHITLLAHAMPDKEPRMIRAAMRLVVPKPELVVPKREARA